MNGQENVDFKKKLDEQKKGVSNQDLIEQIKKKRVRKMTNKIHQIITGILSIIVIGLLILTLNNGNQAFDKPNAHIDGYIEVRISFNDFFYVPNYIKESQIIDDLDIFDSEIEKVKLTVLYYDDDLNYFTLLNNKNTNELYKVNNRYYIKVIDIYNDELIIYK